MPDMSDRGSAWRRAYPGKIKADIREAIKLIEHARMTLTPHRQHLISIDQTILYLGKIQEHLQEQHNNINREITP